MRVLPLLLCCLGLCVFPSFGGRTGKAVDPGSESEEDVAKACPKGDSTGGSLSADHSRKRPSGVKGVPTRRNSDRAVKQKIDYEDLDAELDKLFAHGEEVSEALDESEVPKHAGPSPKTRRSRFEFPRQLQAPKAG
jgi:hypothetical protein